MRPLVTSQNQKNNKFNYLKNQVVVYLRIKVNLVQAFSIIF